MFIHAISNAKVVVSLTFKVITKESKMATAVLSNKKKGKLYFHFRKKEFKVNYKMLSFIYNISLQTDTCLSFFDKNVVRIV